MIVTELQSVFMMTGCWADRSCLLLCH